MNIVFQTREECNCQKIALQEQEEPVLKVLFEWISLDVSRSSRSNMILPPSDFGQ